MHEMFIIGKKNVFSYRYATNITRLITRPNIDKNIVSGEDNFKIKVNEVKIFLINLILT